VERFDFRRMVDQHEQLYLQLADHGRPDRQRALTEGNGRADGPDRPPR
jgi:hypothetical protein